MVQPETTILFVKPKAISQRDKKALQVAGVIVVEVENPQDVKFTRAATEISSSALLCIAMESVLKSGYTSALGEKIAKAIVAAHGNASPLVGP